MSECSRVHVTLGALAMEGVYQAQPSTRTGCEQRSREVLFRDMGNDHPRYCIYIDTLLEGTVPSARDEKDLPCVFNTRVEAEHEIADNMIARLQEFMDGDRDFEDAMTVEEYVVEVEVLPDGSVTDADGNHFASRRK